jgi:hypothetical protein
MYRQTLQSWILRGCIQKFPDWVGNEVNNNDNNNNSKHSLGDSFCKYVGTTVPQPFVSAIFIILHPYG